MGYVAIGTKIIDLLDDLGDFSKLYNYDPNELGGYPAATVAAIGHQNTFKTIGAGGANDRQNRFMIRLYYRTDNDEDAESILRDLADKVITKIEANVTVAGVWDIAEPTESVWRTGEREVPILAVEITATFRKYETR